MTIANKLLSVTPTTAGGDSAAHVDDVFSVYTYKGNGTSQTLNVGIDFSTYGGLAWIRNRNSTNHMLFDTVRGATYAWNSNGNAASTSVAGSLTAFTSTGFSVGSNIPVNNNGDSHVVWSFRKAAKFFDVISYTGDGAASKTITHAINGTVGQIIIKRTDAALHTPFVWHRGFSQRVGTTASMFCIGNLMSTNALSDGNSESVLFPSANTDTTITVGSSLNTAGATYIMYVFGHDTTTDGKIQCGTFTTDASGNATISLGVEPQYVMFKAANATSNWLIIDTNRGWSSGDSTTYDNVLYANTTDAETSANFGDLLSTGFSVTNLSANTQFIYTVVRRPTKVPTSGTQVFNTITRTGTNSTTSVTGVGFPADTIWVAERGGNTPTAFFDRLRGTNKFGKTTATAETADTVSLLSFDQDGFTAGSDGNTGHINLVRSYVNWFFKRAPGFYGRVYYRGTGVARTVAHNLKAVPELMIVKRRELATAWPVYHQVLGPGSIVPLSASSGVLANGTYWNSTTPTDSVFTVGTNSAANANTGYYDAYLFASLPGVSKVGSYTGNGASQTINCGFTAGARFIFIRRADSTGGHGMIFDTTRGIVAGTDPYLITSGTVAESSAFDAVDPDPSGFIVNDGGGIFNAAGVLYIYLAIA